jgi:hypothetical protein
LFHCRFSDLLARHVNKCHANEKQTPAVNANRRKGSASASRATTSKQACDQCVQSSLPCDGCNPCGKYGRRMSLSILLTFFQPSAYNANADAHTSNFIARLLRPALVIIHDRIPLTLTSPHNHIQTTSYSVHHL